MPTAGLVDELRNRGGPHGCSYRAVVGPTVQMRLFAINLTDEEYAGQRAWNDVQIPPCP